MNSKRNSTILKISEYWQFTAYLTTPFQLGISSSRSVDIQAIKADERGLFITALACKRREFPPSGKFNKIGYNNKRFA
jgi:hypothetical protein